MRTTLLLAFFVTGCASSPPPKAETPPAVAQATPPVTTPAPTSTPPPSDDAMASGHTIRRGELAQVLDASPGYFLQHVVTEPQLENGHFHGWKLVSFFPGDARFAGVDLQAGDVVVHVNGQPIEQPDQFMAVWDALRRDSQLVVDVERNGATRTLRWTIADK